MKQVSLSEEEHKEIFLEGIKESIRNWMGNEYPDFDRNLSKKITEISQLQNEFKLLINDVQRDTRNQRAKDTEIFKDEIEKFIKKEYPEISRSILDTAEKLKSQIKNVRERERSLDEKLTHSVLTTMMKKMKKAFEDETE